ncbi:MAG: hypothetical protein FJ288_18840 [Planctomycetes bacterium]|nr:hypothetical protein [Planctomycetota bacterium]
MRWAVLAMLSACLAAAAVACHSWQAGPAQRAPPADSGPLLLDGGGNEFQPPAGPAADNSRCHVCHLNYVQEELAVVHARAAIGCAKCHGDCDAHIADESWASGGNGTPPGIMYPLAKINPFCLGCHPPDRIPAAKHKAFLAGSAAEKHCTDCHGRHRLAQRKCKWK